MAKAVYIHIPFCRKICSYCDFCKVYYNEKWTEQYLLALKKEIKQKYKGEKIKTIYFGGGSPSSLNIKELETLLKIIENFNLENEPEITIECNNEDLTNEKLQVFKKYNINRLSIGLQTFNPKFLKKINRTINLENIKLALNLFDNVNLDLMYAFPYQRLEDVKKDVDEILKLNPKHISLYALIIEENTKFYIDKEKELDEDVQRRMYDYIREKLCNNGYTHYEISNFAQKNYESRHNLTCWNNEEYYGFGMGASGYLDGVRYENTKSINKYLQKQTIISEEKITLSRKIEDEFMLGLRKIEGLNKTKFFQKYKIDINRINDVSELLEKNLLIEDKQNIKINPNYIFVSNEIMEKFINMDLPIH